MGNNTPEKLIERLMKGYTGMPIVEFREKFKQRLMTKWEKTEDRANLWMDELTDLDIVFFMIRYHNNPDAAADDDMTYYE